MPDTTTFFLKNLRSLNAKAAWQAEGLRRKAYAEVLVNYCPEVIAA